MSKLEQLQQRKGVARGRLSEMRSSLPYIAVTDPRMSPAAGVSSLLGVNVEAIEASKSSKKRSKRADSPMAQYALFPMPPSRPPLSASPLSAQFPSPPTGTTGSLPRPSSSSELPNTGQKGSEHTNRRSSNPYGPQDSLTGLGISHLLDSYRSATPASTATMTQARQSYICPYDGDDAWSVASSTDVSIYAVSTASSSSLDLSCGEDRQFSIARASSSLNNSGSSSRSLYYSASATVVVQSQRLQRSASRASVASSADSLRGFDQLVNAAKQSEEEAAARQAAAEAAEAQRLADELESEALAWEALQEDREELQDEEYLDSGHAYWQDSARSMASLQSLQSQMSRPDMRSRQSTGTTIKADWPREPKRKIVFDDPSSSDEEAFDRTLDVSEIKWPVSSPSTAYTRSPASSFGFSRRESNATDTSVSEASSHSLHPKTHILTCTDEPLTDLSKPKLGHSRGLSSPSQSQHLRPLQLPVRVAEHKRQQSIIQPIALQGRKTSLPAISWAEMPATPARESSLIPGRRTLRTASSTPNLKSQLPVTARPTLARFGSLSKPNASASSKESPGRSRIPSGSRTPAKLVKRSSSSPPLPEVEEVAKTLPLRYRKSHLPSAALPAFDASAPKSVAQSSQPLGLPSLNKLRAVRSTPGLPNRQSRSASSWPDDAGAAKQESSPRTSILASFSGGLQGGPSERRSLLPVGRPPRTSSMCARHAKW